MTPKNVIISIKPEYATKIIDGEKKIELRRKFPLQETEGGIALIYASSPIQKIIGYAIIKEVKKLTINDLWKKFGKQACVTKNFFMEYFDGLDEGFALILDSPVKLEAPLGIRRMESEFSVSAPQSFRYAPNKVVDCVAV